MEFEIKKFSVRKLITLVKKDRINLNPPYQRNPILSLDAKQLLIESIKKGYPIPNLFLHQKDNNKFDMVDGQQRTRSIVGYFDGIFKDAHEEKYNKDIFPKFLEYEIAVIVISNVDEVERMEDYYALVNSSGLRLNRPELKRAEYYQTKFLKLLDDLSSSEAFKSLALFSQASLDRLNDIDFISELVGQLAKGITDKKLGVDKLFEDDITDTESQELQREFERIIGVLTRFNDIFPIRRTRYRQRNDFYTLFWFLHKNSKLSAEVLDQFLRLLVLIGEDISPTNEDCEPFKQYALHCVTQSNSKFAREQRLLFFNELLLNKTSKPNSTQSKILEYYGLSKRDVEKVGKYTIISVSRLQKKVVEPTLV